MLRLLFISALPQCGDYSRVATIRSTDVAATIYFSSTAMRRLFEGGYYSKYRRRGYYLFQRYCNAATIRSTDVAATIYFSSTAMRRLFKGDYYSRAATIRSTDVAATIYFSSTAMRRLFEGGYYSKYRCCGYYLFQLYRNAATIRGWLLFEVQTSRLLFISALPQCGDYLRAATTRSTDVAATIYFSATAMRRLFEVQTLRLLFISALPQCGDYSRATTIRGRLLFEVQMLRLLFISALPQCGDYSRAATIRSTDVAATIISALPQRGDYSRAAIYYSKYRRRGYYLFQLYRNAPTIRGWLLFEVQTSRLLFISALP